QECEKGNDTHPEVLGIHVQLVTVQLAELSKGALEVIDVFQAITEGVQHLLAMGLHLTVAHNGISRGQVPKGLKEPLSPGVDNQQPEGIHSLSLGLPCNLDTNLPRASPPTSSTFTLPHRPLTRPFSSAVRNPMLSVCVVASEHSCVRSKCKLVLSLLFLLCPGLILPSLLP
uniref:Uncharacterized protein n=1 Tax=Lynx canadensis TaxID=61383 RepID=A0A667H5E9_LYNCA